MNSRASNLYRFSFALFDIISLNVICFLLLMVLESVPVSKPYILFLLVANIAWISCAYVSAVYIGKSRRQDGFFKRSIMALLAFSTLLLLFIVAYNYSYSRLYVFSCMGSFGIVLVVSRTIAMGTSHYLQKQKPFSKKIVVVGYNELSKRLVDIYGEGQSRRKFEVEGYFESAENVKELSKYPILGDLDEVISYSLENKVQEIYSTISPEKNEHIYQMAQEAERNFIRFKLVPDFSSFVNRKVYIDFERDIPILSMRPEPLEEYDGRFKKRVFDVLFSAFVIVAILSWLVPIIAVFIKLSSKGPVFFKQLRSGKNNQPFWCIKFRTLRMNDEANSKQVTRNDNRITRVGKFLRKSNLDEMPQFLNVFMGDMSIVGPRPHMLKHTEEYSQILNEYMIRHFVKPGVTGWAQINGYRGEITEKRQLRGRIEHDIWYMENWSMWMDLKIILLTVYKTVKGDEKAF
ncbi:undecaprenyl-phosphate glucose phosphotransferase [Aridibaculum aurantiacum]|uniref:undecaprenyl-phosphate glucose phosphotransferase n=1 Tax=Aridibaculum aurantiacum TaxID=2810307 RepID=UPI001A95A487|nr:undecaprenyl-phosphate glucose phosphotransferase [Aridibaculum aurantiacum]